MRVIFLVLCFYVFHVFEFDLGFKKLLLIFGQYISFILLILMIVD